MAYDYDLLIKTGRVFCAETGLDGPGAVAFKNSRIVFSGPNAEGSAREILELPDCIMLPGLIDMHCHPAPATWKYGIDPDVEFLPAGVTTII